MGKSVASIRSGALALLTRYDWLGNVRELANIIDALEQTGGVGGGDDGAARLLNINRTTLLSRMDRLGIDPAAYR